jgi:hypothetical protein
MTYLDLVNKVLLRLREPEVTTVQGSGTSNQYARLIGEFVNEAKSQVESAWDWSALRTTLTLLTDANVFNYELNGTGNNFKVLDVLNDTSNFVMYYKSGSWFNEQFLLATPETGEPAFYNFNGVSADGDTQVDIYPVPDGEYQLRFNVTLRNAPLSADADNVVIPTRPIILFATAMAIEERGEDGGQQSINAYGAARSALADEIALDAARHQEDTIWYPA